MGQILDSVLRLWPVLVTIGGGFFAIAKWLTAQLKTEETKRNQTTSALTNGMQAMIRQTIIDNHAKYSQRASIPFYALENVEKLYAAYKGLGGNSFVSELMQDIRHLPVTRGGNNYDKC